MPVFLAGPGRVLLLTDDVICGPGKQKKSGDERDEKGIAPLDSPESGVVSEHRDGLVQKILEGFL